MYDYSYGKCMVAGGNLPPLTFLGKTHEDKKGKAVCLPKNLKQKKNHCQTIKLTVRLSLTENNDSLDKFLKPANKFRTE